MAFAHLEAHLSVVSQKLAQIAVRAEKAKTATKALTEDDLLKLMGEGSGGLSPLVKQINERGGFLGGFLNSLIKLLTDQDQKNTVRDRQLAIETERIIKKSFPFFSLTQFENLLHKVLNDRDRVAEVKRNTAPAGGSGGASASGVFAFRVVNKNGKPTIDILNDAGVGAAPWYKPDDPDWLKIQNSLNGIKG